MNIGIDIRLYSETGVGRYIRNLVANIGMQDKTNAYTLIGDPASLESIPVFPGWQCVPVNIRWHSLEEQFKLLVLLNRLKLDLIHFPYFSYPVFYLQKFVVTIHDITHLTHATGKASTLAFGHYFLKQLAFRFVLNSALKRSCAVIVPSNSVRSELLTLAPQLADKIHVTYEGLLTTVAKDQITNLPRKKYLLYVGNVYPHKNAGIIIKLLKVLDLTCVFVVKDGYFAQELKKYAQHLGVAKRITWLTDISDQYLASLYANALCLVSPSLSEGFGLTLVEALQNKCPVVCSDLDIFHEIIENYPFYFNPDDVESLQRAVEMASSQSLGQKNKKYEDNKYLLKRYSWEKMTRKTLQIYTSCLH